MSQYNAGSVSFTLGSQTVTGAGTAWSGRVSVGDMLTKAGSKAPYFVGNVVSDTEITLTAPYAGDSESGASYYITTSRTTNHKIPYMEGGDNDTATIFKSAMVIVDGLLSGLASITAGAVLFASSAGAITSDATNFSYNDTTNVLSVAGLSISGTITHGAASNEGATLQTYTGSGYWAIYSRSVTPGNANYTLATNGVNSFINGSTSSALAVAGTSIITASATGASVTGTGYFSGKLMQGASVYTNAPSSSIGIYSEGSFSYAAAFQTTAGATNYALSLVNNATTGTPRLLSFATGTGGGTERARISYDVTNAWMDATADWNFSSGKLGIKVPSGTALAASLHAYSTSNTVAQIESSTTTSAILLVNSGGQGFIGYTNGTFGIQTSGSSYADKLTITSGGDVSIPIGSLTVAGYIAGSEQSAPAAPAANGFRMFAQDNGAGKTQLMVIFSSGAAQQIAIQP